MHHLKKSLRTSALAAVLGVAAAVAATGAASADVACNGYGECWHTKERYAVTVYPPELGIQFYGDDWRDAHRKDTHYHWMKDRDDDHGYYSHGRWHGFEK